jgi:hypothetical protein
MHNDGRVNRWVQPHYNMYMHTYRPVFVSHYDRCSRYYYPRWGTYYRPWYRYGFYGGWYWGLRPYYDIHTYFWNPVVFWLYGDAWDDYYYYRWYGSDYWSHPVLHTHFPRPGAFYPTESLRDLLVGVSTMPVLEQENFRTGLLTLVSQLEAQLSQRLGGTVMLGRNEIAVTHYQMLEGAVEIDGFATPSHAAGETQFAFKAYLDLNDPANDSVFIPGGDQPTDGELYQLRQMNERIEQRGGTNEFPPSLQ